MTVQSSNELQIWASKQIFSSFPCDCFCQVFAPTSCPPPSQNKSPKFSQRLLLCRIFIKLRSTSPCVTVQCACHCALCTICTVLDETVRVQDFFNSHHYILSSGLYCFIRAVWRIHHSTYSRLSTNFTHIHLQMYSFPCWLICCLCVLWKLTSHYAAMLLQSF